MNASLSSQKMQHKKQPPFRLEAVFRMERSDRKFWLLLTALVAAYLVATWGAMSSASQVMDSTILALALMLSWLAWSRESQRHLARLIFTVFGLVAVVLSGFALFFPERNLGLLALLVLSAGMAAYISFKFVRRSADNG